MEYLQEFKQKFFLLDGMLIETGGRFGEKQLENYIETCIEIADKYYQNSNEKYELLEVVNSYIMQYQNEVSWKYYGYEMKFLNALKTYIEQL